MVSLIRRMRKLRTKLLDLRIGPGAAILPPSVTRIHLDFAPKFNDGHFGPRKFWRKHLRRLKYHNPAIPMTVSRSQSQDGPALLTIHFSDSASHGVASGPSVSSTTTQQTSTAPVTSSISVSTSTRTETIDMKHRNDTQIYSSLMTMTKARPVEPTEEDLQQLEILAEQRKESEVDAKRNQVLNEEKRKQSAILAQARGELAASRDV